MEKGIIIIGGFKMKWYFTLAILVLCLINVFSQTTPESDFTVTLTDDNTGVLITRYRGSAATVRIPATIQGMPVREIGREAFRDNRTITSE